MTRLFNGLGWMAALALLVGLIMQFIALYTVISASYRRAESDSQAIIYLTRTVQKLNDENNRLRDLDRLHRIQIDGLLKGESEASNLINEPYQGFAGAANDSSDVGIYK